MVGQIEPEPEVIPKHPDSQHKEFFVGFTYRNFKAFKKQKRGARGSSELRRSMGGDSASSSSELCRSSESHRAKGDP